MVVLPADHRIDPAREGTFRRGPRAPRRAAWPAGAFGIDDPLVTLGVQPTHAATEYGYLVPRFEDGAADRRAAAPTRSAAFEEKPVRPARGELFESGGVAWNAGMFLWRRGAIRAALEKYTVAGRCCSGRASRSESRAQGGLRPDPAAARSTTR